LQDAGAKRRGRSIGWRGGVIGERCGVSREARGVVVVAVVVDVVVVIMMVVTTERTAVVVLLLLVMMMTIMMSMATVMMDAMWRDGDLPRCIDRCLACR